LTSKKQIFGRDQWLFAIVLSQMDLDNVDTWKRNNCDICDKIYLLVWGLKGIVKFTMKRIFKISKHTLSPRLVPRASGKRSFKQKMRKHMKLLPFVTQFQAS